MNQLLLVSVLLLVLNGCFHQEQDSLSVESLNGLWSGKYQAPGGQMLAMSLNVADGALASLDIDQVPQGITGTFSHVTVNSFAVSMSDGTLASLLVDQDNRHAAYVDHQHGIAVLERVVVSNNGFEEQDMVGDWTGFSVMVNVPFSLCDQFPSSGDISLADAGAGLAMAISDVNGDSTGVLALSDAEDGRYTGQYVNAVAGLDGSVEVLMSDDKMFGMLRLCNQGLVGFDSCSFMAWNKLQR